MAETGESENGEAAEALPPEDESPAVAAELVADQDDGTVPAHVADEAPLTDHSGDGDHRDNT